MSLSLLWVFRKHPDYPHIGTGFQYVEPELAEVFLRDDCAQDAAKTDAKQLRFIEKDQAGLRAKIKPAVRKKILAKPGRYKRRDMRAEKEEPND